MNLKGDRNTSALPASLNDRFFCCSPTPRSKTRDQNQIFSVACQRSDLYTRIRFRILGAGHTDEMTLIIQLYYTIFLHENQHKTKMFFGAFETKK